MDRRTLAVTVFIGVVMTAASFEAFGQRPRRPAQKPKPAAAKPSITVTQIDIDGLAKLLKPRGKPLLINFWATWCDPCREEFPDLVRLYSEYAGRLDMITVSLDDLADIETFVPKFLSEMRSEIPAYLLRTPDESAAIKLVSPNWAGNLPMTVIYRADGSVSYERNGKFKYDVLKAEIDKAIADRAE